MYKNNISNNGSELNRIMSQNLSIFDRNFGRKFEIIHYASYVYCNVFQICTVIKFLIKFNLKLLIVNGITIIILNTETKLTIIKCLKEKPKFKFYLALASIIYEK